ncbi:uncharacterized protein si:ch211-252f13.5 [Gadus chalcogrammus]|uniref:uncharacterized protein si:ch211-252f13.5 n=1 Tax=Gadus chalcogrammus TaxID=1042646 RepID=UPI0024C4DFDE|nr:uncharacterized protein si:ch211-252f13.5 [Gadus chalcogrammus]
MAFLTGISLLCFTYLFGRGQSVAQICRGSHCFPEAQDWSQPCVGEYCSGGQASTPRRHVSPPVQARPPQVFPGYQQVNAQTLHRQVHSAPSRPYTAGFTHPRGEDTEATRNTNPRTLTAEVFHPDCHGGKCQSGISSSRTEAATQRDCKGIECRLPMRLRQKPPPCVGPGCGPPGADTAGRVSPSPVHVTDRAAQFLGDLADSGGTPSSSSSPSSLGVQLTCDMKPGTNEVPEDALVLQLRLSKGQEALIEALRGQQAEVKELQRLLTGQQGALVSQQRDILEQQRRMYDQMDHVKAQYSVLLENIKQMSFQDLQGELDHSRGSPVRAHHTQQAFAVHRADMEARVVQVGRPLQACGTCGPEEHCSLSTGHPGCERCTVCPAGFFMVAECTVHADRICQDRDECLEVTNQCGDSQKCLNTPGGFRCQGMTERDANSGMCSHGYFFNIDMDECQACSECEGDPVVAHCTFTTDTVCSTSPSGDASSPLSLSLSWAGEVDLPPASRGQALGHSLPIVALQIQGREDGELVSAEDGRLVLMQHGLVWLDENLSLSHGCRSFVQVCLHLNTTDDGSEEGRDLSGVRVEQREGRSLQSASISGVAVVAPGYLISLFLKSATQHCNHSDGLQLYDPPGSPLSLLWLSHDTGAVAMTAQAVASAHYHTNYRPVFKTTFASDPYVLGLTHDGRGVRFSESGTVRFVFQQALYSMGQACVNEGFHLLAYLNRNGTGVELSRTFKPGVHYRDTSVSLSGAARVDHGDTLAFEVLCPAQCNVRYFGDGTGISILSLVWVPAAISSSLAASVAQAGLLSGAVRNKPLFFQQTSPQVPQMAMTVKGPREQKRDFVFRESGTASMALDLKLIHSCSLLKVTLLRRGDQEKRGEGGGERGTVEGAKPVLLSQQVGGQMPEGSHWASVALRASFQVRNGTAVFFTLDCVRGRVNQISHQTGSGVSILWVAV